MWRPYSILCATPDVHPAVSLGECTHPTLCYAKNPFLWVIIDIYWIYMLFLVFVNFFFLFFVIYRYLCCRSHHCTNPLKKTYNFLSWNVLGSLIHVMCWRCCVLHMWWFITYAHCTVVSIMSRPPGPQDCISINTFNFILLYCGPTPGSNLQSYSFYCYVTI